jgi:hypothetical protein
MSGRIRIREVRREEIDLDKLVFALLRLAREQLAETKPKKTQTRKAEADDE